MDPFDEDAYISMTPPRGSFARTHASLPVEASEDAQAFEFTCYLPDGCGDDVAVELRGGELCIRVKRAEDGATWRRSFTLLDPVDAVGGAAVVDGNVLRIRLPKADLAPA